MTYCGFYGRSLFSSCFSEHRSDVGEHSQDQPSPDLERGGSTVWSRGLGGGCLSGGGGLSGSYRSHRKLWKKYTFLFGWNLKCPILPISLEWRARCREGWRQWRTSSCCSQEGRGHKTAWRSLIDLKLQLNQKQQQNYQEKYETHAMVGHLGSSIPHTIKGIILGLSNQSRW